MKSKQRCLTKPWSELWAGTGERCWATVWPQHCLGINRMDLSVRKSTTCSLPVKQRQLYCWVGGWAEQGSSRQENEKHDVVYRRAELRVGWMGTGSHKELNKTCLTKPALAITVNVQMMLQQWCNCGRETNGNFHFKWTEEQTKEKGIVADFYVWF